MAVIANFNLKDGKYTGTIRTMTINVKAQIVPNDNQTMGAPEWRVFAGGAELGAGWNQETDDGRPYVSVKLDDSTFHHPIRTAFFENEEEGTAFMIWNHPMPQENRTARAS